MSPLVVDAYSMIQMADEALCIRENIRGSELYIQYTPFPKAHISRLS